MKFIALVSGGKDSCFNILHALNQQHELVAIANLHPRKGRPTEIDSYMFQTVGHNAVQTISDCCQIPIYQCDISENESLVVDELVDLFKTIKNEIEFEGVSVGAIQSTYQQIRVDQACAAVNLRSLAYLWQRPQRQLLGEICDSGLDVRVIKVAGMGLNERHLGKKLKEIKDELLELNASIGLHPCGEGGEYETMVFDAPFFKKRMVMKNARSIQHSTDDVYYLEFDVDVEPKDANANASVKVPVPPLLDQVTQLQKLKVNLMDVPVPDSKHKCTLYEGTFDEVFTNLGDLSLCYHTIVFIKDMSKFAFMNSKYIEIFKSLSIAPSRACIESNEIETEIVMLVYETLEPDLGGKGIHVQGLSFWAPASIGPYSQCRLVNGISYLAGQIGLIPQNLELKNNESQMVLALQNAARVLEVVHGENNFVARLGIVYITDENDYTPAFELWQKRFPGTPLIGVCVSALPRGAKYEYSIQGCDLRYFAYYVPMDDDEDLLYSSVPELISLTEFGYKFRSGFEVLEVQTTKPENYKLKFSTTDSIKVRKLFFNGRKIENLYLNY